MVAGAPTAKMSLAAHTNKSVVDQLTQLVDELLDAHCDTVCLADDLATDPDWAAHLDYLRGLQRIGQQTLALAPNHGC